MNADGQKNSVRDRLKRLIKLLTLPGWISFFWKWFWEIIGWIGNFDVVRDHFPVIKRIAENLSPPLLSYILFGAGVVWLLIVLFYGGLLEKKFKPWKIITSAGISLTIVIAVGVPLSRPGTSNTSTVDRQNQRVAAQPHSTKQSNRSTKAVVPDITDAIPKKTLESFAKIKVPLRRSEPADQRPPEHTIPTRPEQQPAASRNSVTPGKLTIAPNTSGSATIGVNNGTVVVNPPNRTDDAQISISDIRATRIVNSLAQSQTTGKIRVVYFGQNQPEIVDVLLAAFQKAGWQREKLNIGMISMSGFRATEPLYLLTPDPNGLKAQAVITALEAANLDAPVHPGLASIGPMSLGIPDVTVVINSQQQ